MLEYEFQKEFFLVCDSDDNAKLFHLWSNVISFLSDEIMKYGYHVIYDKDNYEWRVPKSHAECFDTLFNAESLSDLNEILEDLWYVQLVRFED